MKKILFQFKEEVFMQKNIFRGQLVKSEDIVCLRPHLDSSFSASDETKILNKKAKFDITKNSPIKYKDLE